MRALLTLPGIASLVFLLFRDMEVGWLVWLPVSGALLEQGYRAAREWHVAKVVPAVQLESIILGADSPGVSRKPVFSAVGITALSGDPHMQVASSAPSQPVISAVPFLFLGGLSTVLLGGSIATSIARVVIELIRR